MSSAMAPPQASLAPTGFVFDSVGAGLLAIRRNGIHQSTSASIRQ